MILRRIHKLITPAVLLRRNFSASSYASEMYQAWQQDPKSVSDQWDKYFQKHGLEINKAVDGAKQATQVTYTAEQMKEKELVLEAFKLIRYYELRGHELANIDPLSLQNYSEFGKIYRHEMGELDAKNSALSGSLDVAFSFPKHPEITRRLESFIFEREKWTLRELQTMLSVIYCGKISFEYMHIVNEEEKVWLMNKCNQITRTELPKERKIKLLHELNRIEVFNSFLNERLKTSKRFGIEGCDTLISGLNSLVEEAVTKYDIEYIGFGMAHRGRLNALANVFQKPLQKIFAEFQEQQGGLEVTAWGNSGDVKYHLGASEKVQINGKEVKLCILANPSHLETVNGVLMGNVRAVRDYFKDEKGEKTLGVLIHGDAALAGQGICYQSLQMQQLNAYKTSGVIHIVANNQIGFTTTPAEARTGLYCTDVAKSTMSPIIHVNGDQPELVDQAIRLAVEYRQKFQSDIFIDIVGYRRYGHNEQDQPSFTQPMMYQKINEHRPVYHMYRDRIISEGIISKSDAEKLWNEEMKKVKQSYSESMETNFDIKKWTHTMFHRVVDLSALGNIKNTGVDSKILKDFGKKICEIPQGFNPHPMIKKIYEHRMKSIETGTEIDYATAQALAFATLLKEGFNVRMTGQDVQRGTFSHRHAVLTDQKTNEKFMPIRSLLSPTEAKNIHIQNSFLSEYAVLGFEYGYSITNPNSLTIWEAQFGDFANGAQIVIDNYLTSGESKWGVESGLVVNLPHGMDGQGPEHSSARMERFLQLMSEDMASIYQGRKTRVKRQILNSNMQIVNCSFAANYFHALRRQMRRQFRKPLINFVSKKLLKFKPAMSGYDMFADGFRFFTVMPESHPEQLNPPEGIKKVLIVSGQAYYSVLEEREKLKRKDVAIVRIEQLAPFPFDYFKKSVETYRQAKFVWFQEEHKNSGAWNYIEPRIHLMLSELKKEGHIKNGWVECISRKTSASPAVGMKSRHDEQQVALLAEAFKE